MFSWPDIQTMLENIVSNIPQLAQLVAGFAWVAGLLILIRTIFSLKEYGEQRGMMSQGHGLVKTMGALVCALVLMWLPAAIPTLLMTIYGQATPSPLAYASTDYMTWGGIVSVAVMILEFFGLISFVRGWMVLASLGKNHGGAPHGTFGKALSYIIGGILLLNIVGTTAVVQSTLGIQWTG